MRRRTFIQNSAALALPLWVNGLGIRAFGREHFFSRWLHQQDPANEHILVIVQLTGGNDGLNSIIPLEYYSNYYGARKNIAVPEKAALPLDKTGKSGMHPALEGLQHLYKEGQLAILHSVGYPHPNLSHFSSTDIWMSASDSNYIDTTGWAGRYCDEIYPGYPEGYPSTNMPDPPAIQVGPVSSLLFRGSNSYSCLNIEVQDNAIQLQQGFRHKLGGRAGAELNSIREMAEKTGLYSSVVQKAMMRVTQQSTYPDTSLAAQLKVVAALIKGGLKTKLYLVSYDGFDTHAEQVNPGNTVTGRHANLLRTTGEAIRAFQQDLAFLKIEERVTGMTFSEFGRRIRSNDSLGTDHGAAAPLFLFGKNIKGGIYGQNPVIPAGVSNEDNIPMQIDFRSVYASLLVDWFKLSPASLKKIMPAYPGAYTGSLSFIK